VAFEELLPSELGSEVSVARAVEFQDPGADLGRQLAVTWSTAQAQVADLVEHEQLRLDVLGKRVAEVRLVACRAEGIDELRRGDEAGDCIEKS